MDKHSHYKNEHGSLNSGGRKLRLRLARKGVPVKEIAEKLGIRRQAVDSFIKTNGIYETWKKSNGFFLENRDKPKKEKEDIEKQKRNNLEAIACQVNEILAQRIDKASPIERKSYGMAVRYLEGFPKRYSFGFLFDFYNHVNSLIEKKKRFSYHDLAAEFNLKAPAARRIVKSVGLKSSNKPLPKKIISEEQKLSIRRSLDNTNLSYADIASFTGTSNTAVKSIHDSGPNGRIVNPEDMFFADFGCNGRLTIRKASQIYELMGKGVNLNKIKSRLRIGDKVLYEAIVKREEYSEKIMNNLRKIYPEIKITKPYLC